MIKVQCTKKIRIILNTNVPNIGLNQLFKISVCACIFREKGGGEGSAHGHAGCKIDRGKTGIPTNVVRGFNIPFPIISRSSKETQNQ